MPSKRAERVGPLILEEISQVLITKLRDPRLLGVTFTRVSMTGDLKIARVYWSVIGDQAAIDAAAEALAGGARGVLKRALSGLGLRYLPELEFHYDPSLAYADRIDHILHDIHEQEKHDADPGATKESEPPDEDGD